MSRLLAVVYVHAVAIYLAKTIWDGKCLPRPHSSWLPMSIDNVNYLNHTYKNW